MFKSKLSFKIFYICSYVCLVAIVVFHLKSTYSFPGAFMSIIAIALIVSFVDKKILYELKFRIIFYLLLFGIFAIFFVELLGLHLDYSEDFRVNIIRASALINISMIAFTGWLRFSKKPPKA